MDKVCFHPAVHAWFVQKFGSPTPPQKAAWPAIQSGRHTLIAAPTGSGKTLAAFLAAINALVLQAEAGELESRAQVLYVSPLKALSNDIERNLRDPLAGIDAQFQSSGQPGVDIRVQVRSGDTTPAERAAMIRRPPHILVTTPESLYLLLTAESGRRMLTGIRTVIMDEIHAVAGTKRGAHLSLSLERLNALVERPFVRIGLSATQKPISELAQFLTGTGVTDCAIVDIGHTRERDLALMLTDTPLDAVMSTDAWEEIYDRLTQLIRAHKTTLVFVNTRRLAERVCRHLSERMGKEQVTSHHGSMAKDQRLEAELRLKSGQLKALVATASLELGIDVGDVDLVCQIGSPRSISTFLQRVGRSGHAIGAIPRGRLFPLTRDELVECAALLDSVRRGDLDRLTIPSRPLDVLAQQIVAEVSARDWDEDGLYELMRRAYSYRNLTRTEFDDVVRMLADGFSTRRGRRSAYLHRDGINRHLRARKGARITALTCGGAIPDSADYQVILEPADVFIGTLNEDFAVESMTGDVFQLGNTSYRIRKIESGRVRVEDAGGHPPTIPFWIGEAPARSDELSAAVSRLRADIAQSLADVNPESIAHAISELSDNIGLSTDAATQITEYLAAAKAMLGVLPTQQTIVLERFFDESGGMQLVMHAPFGSRINRAWGLALRKRFCRKFNFELQAAATEDAIVLSLGETHSFALEEVARYLKSSSVREVLTQALLAAPLFTTHWRWGATIALAIKRSRGGIRVAPALQRMQAEDLVAVVFPDQIACAENIVGERSVPDHPLVNQVISDCLETAMDIDGLVRLLHDMEHGEKTLVARDLPHPSPLAREILNAKPYAFLDDAPLEERRTQAVMSRRWLDPVSAADLGQLDPQAIRRVQEEAWPEVGNADELHDALMLLLIISEREGLACGWAGHFGQLVSTRRATTLHMGKAVLWAAAEQLPLLLAALPGAQPEPPLATPEKSVAYTWTADEAARELVRGRLQGLGPVTAANLAEGIGVDSGMTQCALAALEAEGFVLRGRFTPQTPIMDHDTEWCERRLLARIHRYTIKRLRSEIEPVSAVDFLRFLLEWHGLGTDQRREGPHALAATIDQLEGFEAASSAWERDILPSRIHQYDPQWFDNLCLSGRVTWARLTPPRSTAGRERAATSVRTAPIALMARPHLAMWHALAHAQRPANVHLSTRAQALAGFLARHGAAFFEEILHASGQLRVQAEEALAELVAAGLAHSDGFSGLRALVVPHDRHRPARASASGIAHAGRWTLLDLPPPDTGTPAAATPGKAEVSGGGSDHETSEQVALLLLRRYGVIFKRLLEREGSWLPSWYELLRVFRRLEARGEIRGGRFVAGFTGEQYALPGAIDTLRALRKKVSSGALVSLSASDPLNLVGILTPGMRVPALSGNRVLFRDGAPIAVRVGGKIRMLDALEPALEWEAHNALLRPQIALPVRAPMN
ncbi:MAG: DEAD/DEAH box helicase [Acidiferrobacterales bacterium]